MKKLKCKGKGCGKMLPRDDFYDDPTNKLRDGKGIYCILCVKKFSHESNAKMAQREAAARAKIQEKAEAKCCDKRDNVMERRCLDTVNAGKKRFICVKCKREWD